MESQSPMKKDWLKFAMEADGKGDTKGMGKKN